MGRFEHVGVRVADAAAGIDAWVQVRRVLPTLLEALPQFTISCRSTTS